MTWRIRVASTMLLSLLGMAASIWGLLWNFPSAISGPGCGSQDVPTNCIKITFIFHRTLLGPPLAAIGCGYFAVMAGLCVPRLWRSRFNGVHALRLLLSATATSLLVYVFAIEPTMTWDRYPVFTLASASVLVLFAMVVPKTARVFQSAGGEPYGWRRSAAIRLSPH
jgi:hypothetical protein